MRIASRRNETDFEINVISLIDVLLTLLMFFVMTTTFVQHSRLKVSLPEASQATTRQNPDALIIIIDQRGRYYIGNQAIEGEGEAALQHAIRQVVGNNRQRNVILRADAKTPNQAVVTAMDALGRLGFTHLALATTAGRGAP